MDNAIINVPIPENEPVLGYAKGSSEREHISRALDIIRTEELEIPLVIGGKEVRTGKTARVRMPHNHKEVLATYHLAGEVEVRQAIDAAIEAKRGWASLPWAERAAVMQRAASIISQEYRYLLNAATMLGQSKTVHQAEIDSACETIDFLRFNAHYASQIYSIQPTSNSEQSNSIEYRELEGFVFTVSPFNFTAIASNLNMAPVMMGNTTLAYLQTGTSNRWARSRLPEKSVIASKSQMDLELS